MVLKIMIGLKYPKQEQIQNKNELFDNLNT